MHKFIKKNFIISNNLQMNNLQWTSSAALNFNINLDDMRYFLFVFFPFFFVSCLLLKKKKYDMSRKDQVAFKPTGEERESLAP